MPRKKKRNNNESDYVTTLKEKDGRMFMDLPETFAKDGDIIEMKVEGKKKKKVVMKNLGPGIQYRVYYGKWFNNNRFNRFLEKITDVLHLNVIFLSEKTWSKIEETSKEWGLTEEETILNLIERGVKLLEGEEPSDSYLVVARTT